LAGVCQFLYHHAAHPCCGLIVSRRALSHNHVLVHLACTVSHTGKLTFAHPPLQAAVLAEALHSSWDQATNSDLSLFLQGNPFTIKGTAQLNFAGTVRQILLNNCIEVRLDSHGLVQSEIVTLAEALSQPQSRSVTQLHLRRNNLGCEGAVLIAQALKGNDTVEQIRLSDNGIGDKGAQALCEMLIHVSRPRSARCRPSCACLPPELQPSTPLSRSHHCAIFPTEHADLADRSWREHDYRRGSPSVW
jgi:hypothetical protein